MSDDSQQAAIAIPTDEETALDRLPGRPEADRKPKHAPRYAVVVLNDDDHSFAYVIELLQKVLGFEFKKCMKLTEEIHQQGRANVWSGPKEVAELKRDQLRTAGPDFYASRIVRYPLGVIIEPLPGS